MYTKQHHKMVIEHAGLNKKRIIWSSDPLIAEQKASFIRSIWNKNWLKTNDFKKKMDFAILDTKDDKEKNNLADAFTKQVQEDMRFIKNILNYSLITENRASFDTLADTIRKKIGWRKFMILSHRCTRYTTMHCIKLLFERFMKRFQTTTMIILKE